MLVRYDSKLILPINERILSMGLHLQIKAIMVPNKQIMAKPPPKEKLQ